MAACTDRVVSRRLGYLTVRLTVFAWLTGVSTAIAAAPDLRVEAPNNKGVVELETGGSAGSSIRIAEDLASIVDDGATRRVLPVVGGSALQIIWDLALLRGIDMAILQADVLDTARQQRSLPSPFTYITKLNNEEFHLLAGPQLKQIADLANQKVNVDIRGSGTAVTAGRIFELLNIPIQPANDRPERALEQLRKGEIGAMAFVAGRPASLFKGLRQDEGLHFIAIPLSPALIDAYVATSLTDADYPGLIPHDQPVDTVAVGTVLAVANLQPDTERYRNVKNFVDIFFTQFQSLLEPGHDPMWREVNLAAELPGWQRFPPAQQWLDRVGTVAQQNPRDVKTLFWRFLDARQAVIGGAPFTDRQRQELFDQFQRWQSGHDQ
jgi:TRAP-type uncharacterized transport system substrate-binding protein